MQTVMKPKTDLSEKIKVNFAIKKTTTENMFGNLNTL